MPGLLDPSNLDPSARDPLSISSILDTPEMKRARLWDTLTGAGMALLQASGPSYAPRSFGSLMGAALGGAAQASDGTEDRYLKRAMVGAQVAKARSDMATDKALTGMFTNPGGGAPSGSATAPTIAMPPTAAPDGVAPNPNNIGNVRPNGQSTGFQQPPTLEDGVRLAVNNVKAYPAAFNNGQPMNLFQIGARWAPKGDGANDPDQWARNVAQIGGLDPNKPLDFNDPATAAAFARGVHGAEHGQKAIRPPEYYASVLGGQPAPQGAPPPQTAGVPPQIPQGSDMPMPGVPNGSGQPMPPVQQAQYQPPQASRPQTMQDVINSMPPGVRQLGATLNREGKMNLIMKYADPGSEAVLDAQTGQVVFIPKTMVGRDPRYQPVESEKLNMDRTRLAMDQEKAKRDAVNAKITMGPGGAPVPNETMLAYEQRLKAMEDEFKKGEEKRKQDAGKSEKEFGQEKAIRNEYESQPAVKAYRTVVPMLESAKDAATRPTRAADLNLVYAFAKLMDPDSVVRESETAGVVATASVADRLSGYINQLNGQAMLSPETRAKLLDELNSRFQSLKESNDVLASQYTDIATAYGLDPSRVVIPIRKPGGGPGGATGNQPSQDELKGWASGATGGGPRMQYVPGKGVVPR